MDRKIIVASIPVAFIVIIAGAYLSYTYIIADPARPSVHTPAWFEENGLTATGDTYFANVMIIQARKPDIFVQSYKYDQEVGEPYIVKITDETEYTYLDKDKKQLIKVADYNMKQGDKISIAVKATGSQLIVTKLVFTQ